MTGRRLASAVVLSLLFAPVLVNAAVYKCVEAGKTVFRDEPCEQGQGKRFDLGATIEDTDPTGNKGDVSGSFAIGSASMSVGDALGIFRKSSNEISIFFIPERYTTAEVQHFRDRGDESVLKEKPTLDSSISPYYAFFNLRIRFGKNMPRALRNAESAELRIHGLKADPKPIVVKLNKEQTQSIIRQLSVFENIVEGDVDLEAEQEVEIDGQNISWRVSVRAPLYFH